MQYRSFGRSGLKTSRFAFGTWKNLGERVIGKPAHDLITLALDAGITTFDTADVYGGAEETLGEVLPSVNRRDFVVISKCFWPVGPSVNDRGLSRKHIVESTERSLSRLRLDYLDVMLCHRYDPSVPMREIVRAFDLMVAQGKILYWGTSEWPVTALEEACAIADRYGWEPPIVEQGEYSLLHRKRMEQELAPMRERHGLGLMGWSPLASGVLAGSNIDGTITQGSLLGSVGSGIQQKYGRHDALERARRFRVLAAGAGLDMAELALRATLAWEPLDCLALGVSSPGQLKRNLAAFDGGLDPDLLVKIREIFPQDTSLT